MTIGAEGEDVKVLTKVRTGLKREFQFAMKAQSEICGSLGRTRSRGALKQEVNDGFTGNMEKKKRRFSGSLKKNLQGQRRNDLYEKLSNGIRIEGFSEEEDAKSDVLDVELQIQNNEEALVGIGDGCEVMVEDENFNVEVKFEEEGVMETDDTAIAIEESSPFKRVTRSELKLEVEDVGSMQNVNSENRVKRPFPQNVKELFNSGILEGLPVKYRRDKRLKKQKKENELKGVVRGSGILCFCSACDGKKVVTPTTYEVHAGSLKKHPLENIYAETGKTLRDVLNVCIETPLTMLEEVLEQVIGNSSLKKPAFCLSCRGSTCLTGCRRSMLVCNSCADQNESGDRYAVSLFNWTILGNYYGQCKDVCFYLLDELATQNAISKLSNPSTLAKTLGSPLSSFSTRVKSQGKLTRKDLGLHKLVFKEGVLEEGTVLSYYAHEKKLLVGYKRENAIWCTHCKSEVSPSTFEAHAGFGSRRKPGHTFSKSGFGPHTVMICDQCEREFHVGCLKEHEMADLKDQFAPIKDPDSGKARDLTRDMVFGEKTKAHDFGGMYCAVLTVNQVVVSAGIFRIFGRDFAELPLVATLEKWKGKGHFKELFRCVENLLGSVGVMRLVLPAAEKARSIWTNKFGFEEMSNDEVERYKKDYPIMCFSDTSFLEKAVPECEVESK
ncbi:hypothetical protein ACFE04_007053 [Oxalis oulophora]